MSEYSAIDVAIDNRGVAAVTLNRPEKRNAMSRQMIAELAAAAASLGADLAVRVVLISARGPAFCAGADLGWMREQISAPDRERRQQARALARMLKAWNTIPKPVIARIQGNSLGGGIGLMAVADIVIASRDARFGLTETRLGLIPATISPYVFARIGEAGARRTFLSAKLFGAEEAVALGLVARSVPLADIDNAVAEEITAVLACAPRAAADAKAMIRMLAGPIDDELIEATADRLIARWQDPESAEGIAAFFEKRKPGWAVGASQDPDGRETGRGN